jgi:hypothetical protein
MSASARPLIHLPRYCRSDSEDVSETTTAPNPRQETGNEKKKKTNSAKERDRMEIRSKDGIPGRTNREKEVRKMHVPLNEACQPDNEMATPQNGYWLSYA